MTKPEIIADSICVDASCLGNPGELEYRGVYTKTGQELFRSAIFPMGTNNLGEFLAIAHGLQYLWDREQNIPIYSDSEVAMLWIRNKQVKTTLPRNRQTWHIWQEIEQRLHWLRTHSPTTPILKWDTTNWGQIPADFGRK